MVLSNHGVIAVVQETEWFEPSSFDFLDMNPTPLVFC